MYQLDGGESVQYWNDCEDKFINCCQGAPGALVSFFVVFTDYSLHHAISAGSSDAITELNL